MIAALPPTRRATPDDLMKVEGKAELINGEIVSIMPSGNIPGLVAGRIYRRLADYVEDHGLGLAHHDGTSCVVPELLNGRESFVPDVAFYDQDPADATMKFVYGAPAFAVEVRSENDYGRSAERDMAAKRADYFEAGTKIVWDVDSEAKVVRVYRTEQPETPEVFGLGQVVSAEPVLPGWNISVDRIFA
jgi:Uma2 family endonuclease